jgi:hypothetical protein
MIVPATISQLVGAGKMDVVVQMLDPDAKTIMASTPNVKLKVGSVSYDVYEMNPTVVPNVYIVRLRAALKNSIAKDAYVTFEV